MHSRHLVALWCMAVMLTPGVLAAQDWGEPWSDPRDRPPRVDVSVTTGEVAPTDWSDAVLLGSISPFAGVFEQVLVRDLRVEPNAIVSVAVTYWRDRLGFRVLGGLSRSSLSIGGTPLGAPAEDLRPTDIDTWYYEVRGAIGLVDYTPQRTVWPYVFVGFGGITYDLSRTITPPLLTFVQGGGVRQGGPDILVVEDDGRSFVLAIDELGLETVPAVNFGVGADFRLPLGGGALGLRVEVSDHLSPSPLHVRIRELSPFGGLTSDSEVDFGGVHHLQAAAGLVVQLGR